MSTDSYEISSISRNAGAEVPFIRPSSLSDDFTGTREVIEHAIDQLSLQDAAMLPICCLYATAPFVLPLDLTQAYELLHNSELSTVVFTAASFSTPIQRALRIDSKGYSFAYDTDAINKRSQDLETFYHDSGQFYWATVSRWKRNENLLVHGRPYFQPRWRVQDIDTEEDWKRAELMHQILE